jgi:hypothetical protein
MTRYALSGVVVFVMFSACAVDDVGVESSASKSDLKPISGVDLEILTQATPIVRGFVAAGSGCKSLGTPVVTGNTVTITLTDYIAEQEGTGISRSTCDVAVEIDLPPGVTVSLDDVTYRGFSGGFSARSTFFREYFFAGDVFGDRRFTVIEYDRAGTPHIGQDDSDDYTSDAGKFTALDRIRSVRFGGGVVVWRANTAMTVRNDVADSFARASIDTVELTNRYFVTFRFGSVLTGQ